jgi:hypothetical protein
MTYRTMPWAEDFGDDQHETGRTANSIVISAEFDSGRPTGLYDAAGHPIWRFRDPIGFQSAAKVG